MNILNIEHVSKLYGDKWIFDDISCGIQEGEKIGISESMEQVRRHFFGSLRERRSRIRGRWCARMVRSLHI